MVRGRLHGATSRRVALAMVFGLFLVACAGEDSGEDATEPSVTEEDAQATETSEEAEPSANVAPAADPVEFSFASYSPESAVFSQAFVDWAERVNELSGGEVSVEPFWLQSLLPATEILPGVRDGRADMGIVGADLYPADLHLGSIVGLPFLTQDAEAHARALIELYDTVPEMKAEYEDMGLKLLHPSAGVGPNLIVGTDNIASIDDLAGQRLRGYGYVIDALGAIGADPVGMAQPEVYESLQRGVLDATSGVTLDLGVDVRFHEVADYFIDPGYGQWASGFIVMRLEDYEALSDEAQAAIDQANEEYVDLVVERLVQREDEACATLQEAGTEIVIWDQAETDRWAAEVGDSIEQSFIDRGVAEFGYEATFLEELLDTYKELIAKHEADSTYEPASQRCLGGS